ncbi:hypothetical protein JCM9279_005234 [Rhodotorula babjevae]
MASRSAHGDHHPPRPAPPRGAPRPSPSLSPSIVSLLNDSTELPTPFSGEDYFAQDSATTHDHPAPPSNGNSHLAPTTSPTPTTPSPSPSSLNLLLAQEPPAHPLEAAQQHQARPRSSHKRPRPTSSSGSLGTAPLTPSAAARAAELEAEGAMEPPSTRMRRSSSISSNPPAPPPPPPPLPPAAAAAPAPAPASAPSPAPAARPPPPPPAPTATAVAPGQPRLEPSIFNVEPIDEFTREVADWLWGFCAQLDWDKVEIEAKVGLLTDSRAGGSRVHLPVPIETILTDDTGLRFESNMTVNQHKAFNMLLNSRVEEAAQPAYASARVRYAHTRELDTFHDVPAHQGQPRRKVRVTRDQKDKSKVHAVEKVRVADMNVFSPKRRFDWRVSVSLEMPAPIPDSAPTHSRHKDRISYSHQLFQVDLTQVSTPQAPLAPPTHELEVEFKAARPLLEEAAKEQRGEDNRYLEMVQGLLNNVRMLIRNASDP